MTINSKAAIKALAITAVLVAGGVWFGISDLGKQHAAANASTSGDPSFEAEVASTHKKLTDAHAEWLANLTPYEVCVRNVAAKQPLMPAGVNSAVDGECGNLHGAPLSAIKAYELKLHPTPLPNCWDNMGAMDRAKNPDAQKLWDSCMTIQALNNKRAAAGFDADQAKLASEQAMHKKPQDDPNAIIPNL